MSDEVQILTEVRADIISIMNALEKLTALRQKVFLRNLRYEKMELLPETEEELRLERLLYG